MVKGLHALAAGLRLRSARNPGFARNRLFSLQLFVG